MDYQGARTSDAIISETMKTVNSLVKLRKSGKSGSSTSSSSSSGSGSRKPPPEGKKTGYLISQSHFNETDAHLIGRSE